MHPIIIEVLSMYNASSKCMFQYRVCRDYVLIKVDQGCECQEGVFGSRVAPESTMYCIAVKLSHV